MKTIIRLIVLFLIATQFSACRSESSCRLTDFDMKGDYCEISVENVGDLSTAFDARATIDLYIGDKANDRTTVGFGNLHAGEEVDAVGYFITSEYDRAEILITWADSHGNYQSRTYTRY